MATTDQSRIIDMNPHLVRRGYERALCMKIFERMDTDGTNYQEFISEFFDQILDFKQKKIWIAVPKEKSREFLKFPSIVNTKIANSPNHISYECPMFKSRYRLYHIDELLKTLMKVIFQCPNINLNFPLLT